MDRKINKMIAEYVGEFKKTIQDKADTLEFGEQEKLQELMGDILNYDRLVLSKDEFSKRKRIQNSIPSTNRCYAKRADGDQCTRKQKEGFQLCGTHVKGTPHGVISTTEEKENQNIVVSEVFAEEIGGIVYYLDKNNHVFSTEDILKESLNPRVITRYEIVNGRYCIPEYGL